MELIHDDILFENWTGVRVGGKKSLRKAWASWFENNRGFRFIEKDLFIDEVEQKALYEWRLEWLSNEKSHKGSEERRSGVDILRFRDGKIIEKSAYLKTVVEIAGKRVPLTASPEQTGMNQHAVFVSKTR